jgi:adenosylhomocysteine nucleosidase
MTLEVSSPLPFALYNPKDFPKVSPAMMQIAILAAIPQEYRPFQKHVGKWRQLRRQPFAVWLHQAPHKQVFLVETGMGNKPAAQAAEYLISISPLDLLVSTGFAGSLAPELQVGDLVWSRELAVWDAERAAIPMARFCSSHTPHLDVFREIHDIRAVRFLTQENPRPKTMVTMRLDGLPTVVDMESVPLATLAHHHGVPFLGLRAISDTLNDEIDWDLGSIVDETGKVRISKVVSTVLRRPGLVTIFHGHWRDSSVAARNLAQALLALLLLPERNLRALARQLVLHPIPEKAAGPPDTEETASGADQSASP